MDLQNALSFIEFLKDTENEYSEEINEIELELIQEIKDAFFDIFRKELLECGAIKRVPITAESADEDLTPTKKNITAVDVLADEISKLRKEVKELQSFVFNELDIIKKVISPLLPQAGSPIESVESVKKRQARYDKEAEELIELQNTVAKEMLKPKRKFLFNK